MYTGAVFFDYDGTLADETQGIDRPTPATLTAARRLREQGFLLVLATGRAKCYTTDCGISFDAYVTSNGAYAAIGDRCVHNILMEESLLLDAIAYMDRHHIYYALETQEACYARDIREPHFASILKTFALDKNIFLPLSALEKPQANKLFITYEDFSQEEAFQEAFQGRLSIKRHRFCRSSDVDLPGITKADGMRAILHTLHLPPDRIYAFGDGVNDYTMLELAGHGVAMKDHAPCLEQVAELVTGSVREEGILQALREYELI